MPADAGPATAGTAAADDDNDLPPGEDSTIAEERAHLARSRDFLHLMRENVLELAKNPMAGDRVSLEYLKADLWRRAEALKDLPDAPLFFGRLDYSELASNDEDFVGKDFHIGRRHVHDKDGTPVVLDWRAPVSRPFYRASQTDSMGLSLRRRFGFAGGALTAYEDERFSGQGVVTDSKAQPASNLLIAEIERPRSGPMRDIVATIQPEQDDIVRADASTTVCVQGAPGTGKTAVGLHRVAYLLYAHKEQVTRRGVIVVGPNLAFLSYIRNVLPALGELDVTQTTVADLVAATSIKGTDTDESATIKGDARMAVLLRNALWANIKAPREALVLSRGSRRLRLRADEIEALATELRERGVRYGTGRDLLAHRIAHVLLTQLEAAGETCDDRTHDAVRRSAPVRKCVDEVWPKVDPKKLVFALLSDREQISQNGLGFLSEAEISALAWAKPPRGLGSAAWSRADQVLIDEAADLIERTPSIAHIVVDEAQDLSPMEIRAIGRRCATGAATVLGDIAQGTTPWAATSWYSLLTHLGKPDAAVRELDVGYRVPRQILDFASRLLPSIAPSLSPAQSLRADEHALTLVPVATGQLGERVAQGCTAALAGLGSVAVICADADIAETARSLSAAGLTFAVLGSDGVAVAAGASSAGPGASARSSDAGETSAVASSGVRRPAAAASGAGGAQPPAVSPGAGGVQPPAVSPGAGGVQPPAAASGKSGVRRAASRPRAASVPRSTGDPRSAYLAVAEMSGASAPDISEIPDMRQEESRLTLVPVTLAKGLEYDHVILVEPSRIATGEAYGLRRLYVALTRAVSRLTVFHAEPLPAELSLHTMEP